MYTALTETPELINILKSIHYDDYGLTLDEMKNYLVENSPLSKEQVDELFSINDFASDANITYMFAESALGTADFGDYVTENANPEGDIYVWNGDEDDPDYCASSFATDNLFIVWGGSCMGDDDSIIIVAGSL